jgi:hypothetical protein
VSGQTIPRRRKTDWAEPPCAVSGCPAVGVLYERVDRIESTINMRFDGMDSRVGLLNELRQEVMADRGLFVLKDNFENRMRVLERTVWTAVGAVMAVGAAAQFLMWLFTHAPK